MFHFIILEFIPMYTCMGNSKKFKCRLILPLFSLTMHCYVAVCNNYAICNKLQTALNCNAVCNTLQTAFRV